VKKQCEEKKTEEKPEEIIPKLVIPTSGKFSENMKVKLSLDKNTKFLPSDSWVGVFHANSENKYDPTKYLSFEYVNHLNQLEWSFTNPGKSITFDSKLPLACGDVVLVYFFFKKYMCILFKCLKS